MLQTDPEMVRKEVIPVLIRMGQEGLNRGTVNQDQFRDFMSQVGVNTGRQTPFRGHGRVLGSIPAGCNTVL